MAIRFDDRVAIVTGAGRGLGRSHAVELGRRGAKVVVNDLGGEVDGSGGSTELAESVADEIVAAGGQAIVDGASVTDALGVQNLVKRVLNEWGRIDILINNAGILRDKSFAKMELDDFRAVLDVHLWGSVLMTKAVWPHMREQKYGRVVFTTSVTGLYGNFGQTNYGAAKAGVIGLMNCLKLEGDRDNIKVNVIAPIATTRMTDSLMDEEAREIFNPDLVSPAVAYLVSEGAPNGMILSAGGGIVARPVMMETEGLYLGPDISPEEIAAQIETIGDLRTVTSLEQAGEQGTKNQNLIKKGRLRE